MNTTGWKENVPVFCGKIPKVYLRKGAGVLREDAEGLYT
jgi:hypothetical protein